MIQMTPAGHTFRTSVMDAVNGEPTTDNVPDLMVNRWTVSIFGTINGRRRPCAIRRQVCHGPSTLAQATSALDGLVAALPPGVAMRSASILPSYTVDGRYVWSGLPLGPGTVGEAEWKASAEAAGV